MTLRELRKKRNISQKQLAEKSGLAQSYICALERGGRKNPSMVVLKGIANSLGVEVSTVLKALEEAV